VKKQAGKQLHTFTFFNQFLHQRNYGLLCYKDVFRLCAARNHNQNVKRKYHLILVTDAFLLCWNNDYCNGGELGNSGL